MSNIIEWRPVKGFEDLYEINNLGQVRSLPALVRCGSKGYCVKKVKIISQRLNSKGYPVVSLYRNDKGRQCLVHRLLAFAFVANPENLPHVNHINGIRDDYSIGNLEWVTHSQNMAHGYKVGTVKPPIKRKEVLNECTGKVYDSIMEASKDVNLSYTHLSKILNGKFNNHTCLRLAV
jgi:hypothetical protein